MKKEDKHYVIKGNRLGGFCLVIKAVDLYDYADCIAVAGPCMLHVAKRLANKHNKELSKYKKSLQ